MNKLFLKYILLIISLYCSSIISKAQQDIEKTYSLQEIIQIAQEQSIDALVAKQSFKQSYWAFRAYKAKYLPSVDISTDLVNFSKSNTKQFNSLDTSYHFYETITNSSNCGMVIKQNILQTGGYFALSGDLARIRNENSPKKHWDYTSNPNISYTQGNITYNTFKWDKKIEPKKYEIAKRKFIQSLEDISGRAIDLFFGLGAAQIALDVAKLNFSNADTLYKISQGRFEMGKISENDLLQMELNYLTSKSNLNSNEINLTQAQQKLRSFLGFNSKVAIKLFIPDSVPHIIIKPSEILELAFKNNPEILTQEQKIIEAERDVAQKRSETYLNGSFQASYGLSKTDTLFPNIITDKRNVNENLSARISFQIPLVDWGLKRSQYKMAKLSQEITALQVKQAYIDFEQDILIKVAQFNMLEEQYNIAKKANFVAEKRYEVTKQRFLIGKIDALDLNMAQKDKDSESINNLNAIKNYWKSFYDIRKITLFDFLKRQPILDQIEGRNNL